MDHLRSCLLSHRPFGRVYVVTIYFILEARLIYWGSFYVRTESGCAYIQPNLQYWID